MDILSILIGLALGGALGAFAYALWSRNKETDLVIMVREQHEREKADLERRISDAGNSLEERTGRIVQLNSELATEQERGRALAARLQEQKAELEQLQARMTTEFENIANRLLTQRGRELNDQQQDKLGTILKPLQE
ncbi:MAG: hypothetical protein ACK6A5_14585, partial [Flavobacteriales bacterium]